MFFEIVQDGEFYDLVNVLECYFGEQISYLCIVVNNIFCYVEIIFEIYNSFINDVDYEGQLGNQLVFVAWLIKGGLGIKFYMVIFDGFDIYVNQFN